MSTSSSTTTPSFGELSLSDPILKALNDVGYETPSPIQAQIIPLVAAGNDVLGQAQTGTGKTAAFALPLLSGIDIKKLQPQVLVLAPTRELAIQVAEAFQRYAAHLKGFHVLPIYGGQEYGVQLRQLKRGVHVVVGTPGRVMDHMRRGTLALDGLKCLVLDEADEMLRMGFIDDVEWILEKTPPTRQIALFSATMPKVIQRIAQKYLRDPKEVKIKLRTSTAETIRQRYWMVSGTHKLEALTRILEAETFDAIIVFVRTKTATVEIAEKLEARGYACAALNGDIPQKQRERTIQQLKAKRLDIVVATDVAARGLDVERLSHVINYDIPSDTESYIHRIGRTGRAGRSGEAILFVAPREKRLLHTIEKSTRQKISMMELPSTETINNQRIAKFNQRITDTLAEDNLSFYRQIMEQYEREHNVPALDVAAALAKIAQGEQPLLIQQSKPTSAKRQERSKEKFREKTREKAMDTGKREPRKSRKEGQLHAERKPSNQSRDQSVESGMERYRLEVGRSHGVAPSNIVGAIANEAGLDSHFMGRIEIHEEYSTIDLPEGMPREVFRSLKKTWIAGRRLQISKMDACRKVKMKPANSRAHPKSKPRTKSSAKPAAGARTKPHKNNLTSSAA